MPKEEKIRKIKANKRVRPPKKWWNKMFKRIRKQYPKLSKKRISQITAGIWHKYPKQTKIKIVRKYG